METGRHSNPGPSPRRAKIALLIASAETGGLVRVTEALATQLSQNGHDVSVISIKGGEPSTLPGSRGWKFESLDCHRVASSLLKLRRTARSGFDVIIVSQFYVGVALALARPRNSETAIVWVEHSSIELWRESPNRKDRIAEALSRRLCGVVEVMAAVSASTAEALDREFHRLRYPAIHLANPVLTGDEPCFRPGHEDNGERRGVVYVGRLSPEKRVSLLLEAFAKVQSETTENLSIIGDGPERENLERIARDLDIHDRVHFLGFLPDPPSMMGSFKTLVLCSDYEGLGNVLIEALAHGCNVVATDCPTGPREILDSGRFGRLVPVRDAQLLAEAVTSSLSESSPLTPELATHLSQFKITNAVRAYETAIDLAARRRITIGAGRPV